MIELDYTSLVCIIAVVGVIGGTYIRVIAYI
jgi:hypothetical protein